MATNLAIDIDLLNEAKRIGHKKTKREVVNDALQEYIERRKQHEAISLFGAIDFDESGAAAGERDVVAERERADAAVGGAGQKFAVHRRRAAEDAAAAEGCAAGHGHVADSGMVVAIHEQRAGAHRRRAGEII